MSTYCQLEGLDFSCYLTGEQKKTVDKIIKEVDNGMTLKDRDEDIDANPGEPEDNGETGKINDDFDVIPE